MKDIATLALLFTGFSVQASASTLLCGSKTQGIGYFSLTLEGQKATVATLGKTTTGCEMAIIPYKPVFAKYAGWIRIAPTKMGACDEFGKSVSTGATQWISLSPEVAAGGEGFAQIGYDNVFDPGSGATMKNDMRCFVKKN